LGLSSDPKCDLGFHRDVFAPDVGASRLCRPQNYKEDCISYLALADRVIRGED
jgi:hypothetical protein